MLDNTGNSVTYGTGDGETVFPIPFPFLESSHIRAWLRGPDGGARALAAGADYTVNMISDEHGEFVLLDDEPAGGRQLTITRLVPLTQDVLFHNQGPNSPRVMETAVDKLTMITQQLDSRIDNCLYAPDGFTADEVSLDLADSAGRIAGLRRDVDSLNAALTDKAPAGHGHALREIDDLARRLEEKVEREAFHSALLEKADRSNLLDKADRDHGHPLARIDGLPDALAQKLGVNDPRLDGMAKPAAHAESHFSGGPDKIRPQDIGCLPAPPSDGKYYLAAAGGWVEYIPSPGNGTGGGEGTSDHAQLLNRNAADQHPQAAIQGLVTDLETINAATAALRLAKADKAELPTLATTDSAGLLSGDDKRKLDALSESADALPGGGADGDFLLKSSDAAAWLSPAGAAGRLPLMSASQKGVARLSGAGGLELDAGGLLGIKADNLLSKANVEARLSGHESRLDALDAQTSGLGAIATRVGTLEGKVTAAEGTIASHASTVKTLGAMSRVADAPSDGKGYVRKNGGWVESAGVPSSGGGAIVGEIRLLPFRAASLPDGWYLCNGDRYSLASNQGDALYSLPASMKSDWGITSSSGYINLPNLFSGSDGYFLRAVNGSSRYPGNRQSDAMRNITATFGMGDTMGLCWHSTTVGSSTLNGAFYSTPAKKYGATVYNFGATTTGDLFFDASRCVPTASEFRPMNVGMTPAIYLGV